MHECFNVISENPSLHLRRRTVVLHLKTPSKSKRSKILSCSVKDNALLRQENNINICEPDFNASVIRVVAILATPRGMMIAAVTARATEHSEEPAHGKLRLLRRGSTPRLTLRRYSL